MVVTLKEVKKHLEIDEDETKDDEYLSMLVKTAEELAESHMNVALSTFTTVPWAVRHAIKVKVAYLYDVDRTGSHNQTESNLFHRLLSAHINYSPTTI